MKSKILTVAAFGAVPLGMLLMGPAAVAQTTTESTTETTSETTTETTSGTTSGAAAPAEAVETTAVEYTVNSALAEVDGVTLSLGELIAIRRELPEQFQNLPDEVLFDGIVEQLIDQMLLAEAGRKAGLEKRPSVAMNLLNQQRAILADAYLRQEVTARATPEAVGALYQQLYIDAEPLEEVRAAHILVESEELVADLKAQLDGGADFAVLAAEHGTDGTAQQGGDLGWFKHSDMVPEFADAVFAMETGTISDPVQSAFGWHLIKLDERREIQPPELAEVRQDLMGEIIQQAQITIVEELRGQATVVMPETPLPPQSIREDAMLDAAE